uniref:Uncharacterized protein n=1 Tax=Megaselia scalaris TaxID=36166 RepID=T1GZB2_MEGSC
MKLKENNSKKDSKKLKVKKGKVEKKSKEDGVIKSPKAESTTATPSVKTISPAIFDYFKNLTNSEENDRLQSGLQLIQHISKAQQDEKREKELQYTLKRLVRGVGASTTSSRA